MALSYKARRRWSLVVLVIGMPLYVILAVGILGRIDRLPMVVELFVYVLLGIVWVFPLKFVFRGIGKPDPDESNGE